MIYGKGAHMAANGAKLQYDEGKRLYAGRKEAEEKGQLFESDEEIKTMPLEEVAKRLRQIRAKAYSDWTNTDNARWERLAWRAKRLGVHNPFTLIKNLTLGHHVWSFSFIAKEQIMLLILQGLAYLILIIQLTQVAIDFWKDNMYTLYKRECEQC